MLRIAAAFAHREALTDTPRELRPLVQALTSRPPRRINRYIELALYGALHCNRNVSGNAVGVAPDTALYLACEAAMLVDCTGALRSNVVEGRPPTPFEFMNISGNMPGFYIAQQLHIQGPQLALHRHHSAFESALELLQLSSGAHRRALVGNVEEGVWPLAAQRQRLQPQADQPLHECSHWLYFDADCAQPLALLEMLPDLHAADQVTAHLRPHASGSLLLDETAQAPWHDLDWSEKAQAPEQIYGRGDTAATVAAYALGSDPRPLWYLRRKDHGWSLLHLFRPATATSA